MKNRANKGASQDRKGPPLADGAPFPDWRDLFGYHQELATWQSLLASERLPPVLLITGREGLGKRLLLAKLTAIYLCHTGDGCGHCDACTWLLQSGHPEVLWLETADGKLNLDEAHRLQEHLAISPGPGSRARIVVVPDVDGLSRQAANALLKTLEEPPPRSAVLLSSSRVHRILPTILSRCVRWRVAPPPQDETRSWLQGVAASRGVPWDEAMATVALKDAGLAPGGALQLLGLLDETKISPDLTAQSMDRLRSILDFDGGAAQAPDTKQSWIDVLTAAESLTKESGLPLEGLLDLAERSLNQAYQETWAQPSRMPHSLSTIVQRRRLLRSAKLLVGRGRVPLNAQLLIEALALAGETSSKG